MDNRHCLSYTIGKKDEMERMYLLVEIRSKFQLAIKIASSVLLKIHELANTKIFHWKVWPGWDAEWRAGSESFLVSSCSACLIDKFRADSPT